MLQSYNTLNTGYYSLTIGLGDPRQFSSSSLIRSQPLFVCLFVCLFVFCLLVCLFVCLFVHSSPISCHDIFNKLYSSIQ